MRVKLLVVHRIIFFCKWIPSISSKFRKTEFFFIWSLIFSATVLEIYFIMQILAQMQMDTSDMSYRNELQNQKRLIKSLACYLRWAKLLAVLLLLRATRILRVLNPKHLHIKKYKKHTGESAAASFISGLWHNGHT